MENHIFNSELERLKTFEFFNSNVVDVKKLALLGFYNFGSLLNDSVKCYFCNIVVGEWQKGDDVLTEHLKWSKDCKLLTRGFTKNISLNENELGDLLPPVTKDNGSDVCGSKMECQHPEIKLCTNAGVDSYVKSVKTVASRVDSFNPLLCETKEIIQKFSEAGFFYCGPKDYVQCFHCGGGLSNWFGMDTNIDPCQQHALLFPECKFSKKMKGGNFIMNKILSKNYNTK